jgi:hypothetical protein
MPCRYTAPNAVTLHMTYGSPCLCFLPPSPWHLCYDTLVQTHGGRTPGREDTGWILSRW